MPKTAILLAAALLTLLACTAQAADRGFYIGAGVGAYTLDIDDTDFDDNATVAKALAGFRVADHWAIEADYQKLFESSDDIFGSDADLEADAWTVAVRPILPVTDFLDLYAKAGYTWYDFDIQLAAFGPAVTQDESDGAFTWGGGVDVNLGNLSLRGEVSRIEIDDAELNLVTAGLIFRF